MRTKALHLALLVTAFVTLISGVVSDSAAAAGATLSVSPTSVQPGATLTVSWSGISPASPSDWFGWYQQGAPARSYLDYRYVSCTKTASIARSTGSCQLTISSKTQPGNYQIALLGADGYQELAPRVSITVGSGGSTQPTATPTKPPATAIPTPAPTSTPIPTPGGGTSGVVWSADHENGSLAQWTANGTRGGSYDSGSCTRPSNGVTSEQAHSGRYSMKLTIDTRNGESGCRQFRHEESAGGGTYYYSAWLYLPQQYTVNGYWNMWQFKSQTATQNDAVWVLEPRNRSNGNLHLMLRWKGIMAGPTSGEGTGLKYFDQTITDVPIGRWFHVETYLRQSEGYTGQIRVWQDGTEIFNMNNVKTKYPGGDNRWSVNLYSDSMSPSPSTMYVDDARVSTSRVGPQ